MLLWPWASVFFIAFITTCYLHFCCQSDSAPPLCCVHPTIQHFSLQGMIIHKWTDSRHVCSLSPCNQASHFNSLWSGHVIWMQKGCSVSDQDSCNPLMAIPCGSAGKESACRAGDLGSNPGLGRSPGEGKGYLLQYSGLENSMDCIVHGVTKSWTWLSDFHFWWPWGSQRELIPGCLRPSHGQKVRLGIRTTGCGATTQICNCGKLCHFSGAKWPLSTVLLSVESSPDLLALFPQG